MDMTSKLTKNQVKTFGPIEWVKDGVKLAITARVRHDDNCGNGHNSFSIVASVYDKKGRLCESYAAPNFLPAFFPELEHAIKFHLCSTDGPLHYIANTLYHIKQGRLDYARKTAIWPDATDEQLKSPNIKAMLEERLPALMREFKTCVESLGFIY